MGKVRDFLVGLGLLSSAGATVSNAGVKLLNVRNQLGKLAKDGATGREPMISEAVGSVVRTAARNVIPAAKKAATAKKKKAKTGMTAAALERKRKYNRERMRRLRAKKKA